jgi:hypothetical protein
MASSPAALLPQPAIRIIRPHDGEHKPSFRASVGEPQAAAGLVGKGEAGKRRDALAVGLNHFYRHLFYAKKPHFA